MSNHEWHPEPDGGEDIITEMCVDDVSVKAIATAPSAMSEENLAYEVINLPDGKSAIIAVNKGYISHIMSGGLDEGDEEDMSEEDFMESRMRGAYSFGVTIGQVLTMTCMELHGDI
mgnify:FL=1